MMVNEETVKRIKEGKKNIKRCDKKDIVGKIKQEFEIDEIKSKPYHNIYDYTNNIKEFYKNNPFFYDDNKLFWLWSNNKKCYKIVDETTMLVAISKSLSFYGQLLDSKIKSSYIEGFKQFGRLFKPKEAPKTWVQFKEQIIDINTKEIFEASPKYFLRNPIPHNLGESSETPVIDKLFEDWVGPKYIKTLKQIIAYCCLQDYPIHRFFCFVGSGRNGKSQLLKMIKIFLGEQNITSAELDKLASTTMRFETAKLYNKLACFLSETNFGTMKNTSTLKMLTGGDSISMEIKNKNPFEAENYAKILINSNSLPTSLDTSDGFYRRWVIIKFNNEFTEGKDIIKTIPIKEYGNLARMVVEILPELYETGKFVNEGTIEERKQNYIMNSNPLPFFLQKLCEIKEQGTGNYIKCNELYNAYVLFLNKNKKRKVSRQEFYSALEDEGIFKEKTTRDNDSTYFFINIKLKDNWRFLVEERIEKEFDNYDKNIIEKPKKIKMGEYTQEINKLNKIEVRDVLFHLDKFGTKQEMEIVQLKEDLDIDDKYIDYMLEKGYVFKPQPHLIKVL
jgi:putative DNA primase/helicase